MSRFIQEGVLYVVRRPFKANGKLYNIGEVVENPTDIKLFRSRLGDRDIIAMSAGNTEINNSWFDYMAARATEVIDSRIYELCGREMLDTVITEEPIEPVEPDEPSENLVEDVIGKEVPTVEEETKKKQAAARAAVLAAKAKKEATNGTEK